MTYQVLARKYRSKNFSEVVGQPHATKALSNALTNNRLHHAYLFSGTRGVGKTTLARIFAACLNCEKGISAKPCGKCHACKSISQNKFVDLIEIDAASRTRIEDTREILDNVQYRPSIGRFKIYLIDEVHMLSGHSFNALLKTLEEPPEHVKFLLATTEPHKLPVTVLSRCLQFNLKLIPSNQLAEHLNNILKQEKIKFETSAINKLAQAAHGSARDALSLLDQAIAYTNANISDSMIDELLGNVDNKFVFNVLETIAQKNAKQLIKDIDELAKQDTDFSKVLSVLATVLHKIALLQLTNDSDDKHLTKLAQLLAPEDIQLYYQIATMGQRDLPLAPTPRCGFEMTLLRMLAFELAPPTSEQTPNDTKLENKQKISKPAVTTKITDEWVAMTHSLKLDGLTAALAAQCSLQSISDNEIKLIIANQHAALHNKTQEQKLTEALHEYFGKPIKLTITQGKHSNQTPAQCRDAQQLNQHQQAVSTMAQDKNLQKLGDAFGVVMNPDWVKTN